MRLAGVSPQHLETAPGCVADCLVDEACLAHPGFALDDDNAALAAHRQLDVVDQPRPLGAPADERHGLTGAEQRHRGRVLSSFRSSLDRTHDSRVELLDFGRGLQTELIVEHRATPLVLLKRIARAAEQEAEPHDGSVCFLSKRVVIGEAARVDERGLVIARCGQELDEQCQRVEVPLTKALLLEGDPVVVEAGKEVAGVQLDGRLEHADRENARLRPHVDRPDRVESGLELLDVEPIRRGPVDGERVAVRQQIWALTDGFGERVLNLPERLTQPSTSLALGEIRPEEPRQPGPRVMTLRVHGEVCEQ